MTCIFRGPGWIVISVCSKIKLPDSFLFAWFFFTIFCRFLRLHGRHCPKISNYFSPLHTLFFLRGIKAGNPEQAIPSGQDGTIFPLGQPIRTLFIVFMGIASNKINQNYVFGRLNFAISNRCSKVASIILCNFGLKSYSAIDQIALHLA